MFNKLGRAGAGGRGGGGNGKRSLPPPVRPVGPVAAKSRASVGPSAVAAAVRLGSGHGPGGGVRQVPEETFSMIPGGPLDFASIIRLTPILVEEIRRVEERGGAVRIKFDSNSNDSSANVIDVDGKEFRFTWSKDSGLLCDIYEECQNGESGDGLLVERGSAWRKLNVLRILDESLKNQVKMRSEEAERQLKARRAIVLDPANPSVKNQSSAAAEGRWTPWKRKKEPPFKKQKIEITQATKLGQSMSAHKTRMSPNIIAKVGRSSSPALSPPEKIAPRASASPNLLGTLTSADIVTHSASSKENAANYEKETEDKTPQVSQKMIGQKIGVNSHPLDLRNMTIALLAENPKGITLKAIEKSVREALPNSTKKIENVLKNVANFQAPGRYFLKPGIEIDSSSRLQSENGCSLDNARAGAMSVNTVEKINFNPIEQHHNSSSEQAQESDIFEKSSIHNISGGPFTKDGNVKNETELQAQSSSESGSDSESESDSSDSGSDSRSQSKSGSKSKSPIASESGSSSDSDSDASSSSKETNVDVDVDADVDADVDVDITSDDEKDDAKSMLLAANLKVSSSPLICATYNGQCDQKDRDEQDDHVPSPIPNSFGVGKDDNKSHSIDKNANLGDDLEEKKFLQTNKHSELGQVIPDHRQPDTSERATKIKSKKSSKINKSQESVVNSRKPKTSMVFQSSGIRLSSNFTEQSSHVPPEKSEQNQYKNPIMTSDAFHASGAINNIQTDHEKAISGRHMPYGNLKQKGSSPNFQKSSYIDAWEPRHSPGDRTRKKPFMGTEQTVQSFENHGVRGTRHNERKYGHCDESDAPTTRKTCSVDKFSIVKDKHQRGSPDEDIYTAEKSTAKPLKVNVAGEKLTYLHDSQNRKSIEQNSIQKDTGHMTRMHRAEVDSLPVTDVVKEGTLKRCLSELEAGEFREPLSVEDIQSSEGQLEWKASSIATSYINEIRDLNLDMSKDNTGGRVGSGNRRLSPSSVEGRIRKGQGTESFFESSRPQQGTQQFPRPRIDAKHASHFDSKSNQLVDTENHTSSYKKDVDSTEGKKAISAAKHHKFTESRDSADQKIHSSIKNGDSNGGKGTESSPDEDFHVSKLEKDEPELRGPINDLSQYKEYVQVYEEKYECYLSLRDQIEKVQNEFLKICSDLPELSRQRDTEAYDDCYRLARDFHRQHKMGFTRLKKQFIIIYEELVNIKHRIKIFAEEYTVE